MSTMLKTLCATTVIAATTMLAPSAWAMTDAELDKKIHDYIMSHPEVLAQSIAQAQEAEEAAVKEKKASFVRANSKALFDEASTPSIGAEDPDVTIVEFFDYNCGACKMMFRGMELLMQEDKKVRFFFKEFPIFGERSEALAKLALSVHRLYPDKYFPYHAKLMRHQGKVTLELAYKTIVKLGMDQDKLKLEASKPSLEKLIRKNSDLAEGLGARGTPTLVIGDEIIPSALSITQLKTKIKQVRDAKQ